MTKQQRDLAKRIFSAYGQEFEPTLVQDDENFYIMDWRDKNGSGNLATRYIVDRKNGDLIITGDAGDCIASWHNEIKPEDLAHYINSIDYFISKFQCSTNKYTYRWDDVLNDLDELKREYLGYVRDGDIDVEEGDVEEDFAEMRDALAGYDITEDSPFPERYVRLASKYNPDWWESDFVDVGRRVDTRIYLWVYGYQEGIERIRGREFVNKGE